MSTTGLDAAVTLEGVTIESKVMRKNLDTIEQVYAYVVTIGSALEDHAQQCDPVEKYYLDSIGNMAVRAARKQMEKHLRAQFGRRPAGAYEPRISPRLAAGTAGCAFCMLGDVGAANRRPVDGESFDAAQEIGIRHRVSDRAYLPELPAL